MRIGFDAKRVFHNNTGLGNYSRDLISILVKYYPNNKYFLYNPKPKKNTRLAITNNMYEVLPNKKIWKKFSSIWRQGPISKQIKQDDITVYHGLSGEIPKGLENFKIKTVVTIHDLIFVRYPHLYSYFDRKIHFKKFLYATKVADKIIAISEQTKQDIVEFLKVAPEKIEVIYQGCHAAFKEEQSQDFINKVLDKYKLPPKFILNVGTIEERKNVLTLVKSIKNIAVDLVVVGRKTQYYQKVEKYIEENNLHQKIYFLEGLTLQELAALYKAATIFVYPSIFEGFGIPIIEALYSKTPVITNANGVFSEAGGPNSIYVNPLDVSELKEAIQTLLNSEEKRKEISTLGVEFVQKFNDDLIAEKIIGLYRI